MEGARNREGCVEELTKVMCIIVTKRLPHMHIHTHPSHTHAYAHSTCTHTRGSHITPAEAFVTRIKMESSDQRSFRS